MFSGLPPVRPLSVIIVSVGIAEKVSRSEIKSQGHSKTSCRLRRRHTFQRCDVGVHLFMCACTAGGL